MLHDPDFTGLYRAARIQAFHDIRDVQRQERITVKGQIRLEPRRTVRQIEDAATNRPTKKSAQIIRGEKRQHVVKRLAETMDQSKRSPFEYEGAVRHGVRSELCLDGCDWHSADSEAAALVAESLGRLHARRPSYDEGQREYTVSPDCCSWCHSPLEDVPGTRHVSYCDEDCARAALRAREINQHRHETRAFNAAWDVVSRSQHPACQCEECGKTFRPSRLDTPNRFCSMRCHHSHRARRLARPHRECPTCKTSFYPNTASQIHCSPACGFAGRRTVPQCTCEHCGTTFRPPSNRTNNRFCSKSCHYAHGHERIPCTCSWCGVAFIARGREAASCSDRCRQAATKYRLGIVPQLLAPHVFDHFVSLPALAVSMGGAGG